MLISQWLAQRQCPSKNSSCSSAHSLINKHLTPERLKIIGLGKHRPSRGGRGHAQTAQTSREDHRESLEAAGHTFLQEGSVPSLVRGLPPSRALLWWDALPSPAPALPPS